MTIKIHSNFDSGNIDVVDCRDPQHIKLTIRPDTNAHFYQWFYFQVTGAKNTSCKLYFLNAAHSSYADGWEDYQAVASYDQHTWFRVPTHYQNNQLMIEHTPENDSIFYAFFAPYTLTQLDHFLTLLKKSLLCQFDIIGHSLQQRPLHLLTIGTPAAHKLKCWLITRQHCGETMGSWWMEGFISRLLDEKDSLSRALLEKASFYIMPMMNPDGAFAGNLRANAAGTDLNRQWPNPSLEKSPEVYYTLNKIKETGVDFFLDVHGDEILPYTYLVTCESNANYSPRLAQLEKKFKTLLKSYNSDFQDQHGFTAQQFSANPGLIASNHIGQTFDCLSLTLEMPFKDNALAPDKLHGWSPARCKKLGSATVDAIAAMVNELR